VHAKVWISDKKDVYIGSANNDWKSLTQVYPTKKKQAMLNLQYGVEKKKQFDKPVWHYFYMHCRSRSLGFILLVAHR
jgi:hypothetical protein